ncbi:hypothetical protein BaRGS_00037554 [Batillaria attramentaria]|uniref:Uncharacterized protein n=1 Tax=Batillaria attramentaria TaxID=370345 RepID=A0ABD0J8D8_9CAEN
MTIPTRKPIHNHKNPDSKVHIVYTRTKRFKQHIVLVGKAQSFNIAAYRFTAVTAKPPQKSTVTKKRPTGLFIKRYICYTIVTNFTSGLHSSVLGGLSFIYSVSDLLHHSNPIEGPGPGPGYPPGGPGDDQAGPVDD